MNNRRLAAIRKRLDEATPGPWRSRVSSLNTTDVVAPGHGVVAITWDDDGNLTDRAAGTPAPTSSTSSRNSRSPAPRSRP